MKFVKYALLMIVFVAAVYLDPAHAITVCAGTVLASFASQFLDTVEAL